MKKYSVVIAIVFIWIGFVCAISFMEAWIKFQAPGVTLPLGLSVGRIVFNALNKVEIVLSLIISISLLFSGSRELKWKIILIVIPVLILAIQTLWFLPLLDVRAEKIIEGQTVPSSVVHFYYIGSEVFKTFCLAFFGINLLKK